MGLFDFVSSAASAVGSFVGGLFGGGSSSDGGGRDRGGSYSSSSESYHTSKVTNYDPDKVRVAELENERVGLVKDAQLELLEFNAKMEAAMIEARCRGFHAMQQAMMGMLKEVNILAEERFILLESGSLEQIQQVEKMYAGLSQDILNDGFAKEKATELISLANQFPEGSDTRQLFMKSVDQELAVRFNFKNNQLALISQRCRVVVESVVESKHRMQQHIDTVITKRIEQLEQVMQTNSQLSLPSGAAASLQFDPPKNNQTSETQNLTYQAN